MKQIKEDHAQGSPDNFPHLAQGTSIAPTGSCLPPLTPRRTLPRAFAEQRGASLYQAPLDQHAQRATLSHSAHKQVHAGKNFRMLLMEGSALRHSVRVAAEDGTPMGCSPRWLLPASLNAHRDAIPCML
eukprot:1158861-Pelagomonas_calceolata.AAC.2